MKIDNSLIRNVLNIDTNQLIENVVLGFPFQDNENMLSFLDTEKFISSIENHNKITALFTTYEISKKLTKKTLKIIICEDPRYAFYTLYNYIEKNNYKKNASIISSKAVIDPSASISKYNVTIGDNVIIEPNVTILPDVVIRKNCIIHAGAVLGTEGFEYKRTSMGILPVFHSGKVILDENVEIGANTCIDKGHFGIDTRIGENTKVDNLVHIAHAVEIGKNCFIVACSMIAGTVKIEDSVWIGPNSNIAPQLTIGEKAFITLGSVVTKNVSPGEWVTGNFAIPHKKFLENLKNAII